MTKTNVILETRAGDTFMRVAEKALHQAKQCRGCRTTVEFNFNGITCLVEQQTDTSFLSRDYHNAFTMEWKTIGPNCVKEYPAEIQAELSRRIEERIKQSKEEEELRKQNDEKSRNAFEEATKGVEVTIANAKLWQETKELNSDPYGKSAFEFAECWGKLMQVEIEKGFSVATAANKTAHSLPFLSISGFQFGCAVAVLSDCWIHGEELRAWHLNRHK